MKLCPRPHAETLTVLRNRPSAVYEVVGVLGRSFCCLYYLVRVILSGNGLAPFVRVAVKYDHCTVPSVITGY